MAKVRQPTDDYWVFGYGSLMWRPGFAHRTALPGRLYGYHRSLCVYSYIHRGTPEQPGLVLGLNRGGSCRGTLFSVPADDWPEVIAYLREREQPTRVYLERELPVRIIEGDRRGATVSAVCYVVDRAHEQYAGDLSVDRMVSHVRAGRGRSGPNVEYVANTVSHLQDVGLKDDTLEAVVRAVSA